MRKCGAIDSPVPEFRLNMTKEACEKRLKKLMERNRKLRKKQKKQKEFSHK